MEMEVSDSDLFFFLRSGGDSEASNDWWAYFIFPSLQNDEAEPPDLTT
jgi:hypothetical protein